MSIERSESSERKNERSRSPDRKRSMSESNEEAPFKKLKLDEVGVPEFQPVNPKPVEELKAPEQKGPVPDLISHVDTTTFQPLPRAFEMGASFGQGTKFASGPGTLGLKGLKKELYGLLGS